MPARLEVLGLNETRKNLEDLAEALHGHEMVQTMYQAVNIVMADVKRETPVDTGRLRASIAGTVTKVGYPWPRIEGVVGTNIEYAPYMEYGTGIFAGNRPVKMPPPEALAGWARRHKMSSYAIAFLIFKRGGLRARKMFLKSLRKNEARVIEILDMKVRMLVERHN